MLLSVTSLALTGPVNIQSMTGLTGTHQGDSLNLIQKGVTGTAWHILRALTALVPAGPAQAQQFTGLTATPVTRGLRVSWNSLGSVWDYVLRWRETTSAVAWENAPLHTTAKGATSYTITGLTPGTEYTVRVTPREGGFGYQNLAATTTGTPLAAPSATITVSDSDLSSGETATVTVTFSEAVNGFASTELTTTAGALSNFSGSDGDSVYTFILTPPTSGSGSLTLNVAADVAQDTASNDNTAAAPLTVNYTDTAAPSATITVSDSDLSSGETATVTVTFSEAVNGFASTELTTTAGALSNFSGSDGDSVYTFILTPPTSGSGSLTLNVAADVAQDTASNDNTAAAPLTVNYTDTAAPTVTITVSDSDLSSGETATVTVTFSEGVSGFISTELTTTAGALSNFSGSDDVYTFTLTPPTSGSGTMTLNVAADVAQDTASNDNTAATPLTVNYTNTTALPPRAPVSNVPAPPPNRAPALEEAAEQTATEDEAFQYQIPAATDPDSDLLSYTATLANGTALPDWLSFDPSTRRFSGTLGEADTPATWTIRVTVTDGELAATTEFGLRVEEVNDGPSFTVAAANQAATEGEAFSYTAPAATDPENGPLSYTATLANGTALPRWLSFDPSTRRFSGTPGEADAPAAWTIRVRVTDGGGLTATTEFGLTVQWISDSQAVSSFLAGAGRAAASQSVVAVSGRLALPADSVSTVTIAGQPIKLGNAPGERASGAEAGSLGFPENLTVASRPMTVQEVLLSSNFHLATGGSEETALRFVGWGRAGMERFKSRDGVLSVDGEVVSGTLGADLSRGQWTTGVALSLSRGRADGKKPHRTYDLESTMTAINPYLRIQPSPRFSAWGMAGWGWGSLSLTQQGENSDGTTLSEYHTDLAMTLAAVGGRAELLSPSANGGFALALKGDAFFVHTHSEAVRGLEAAEGEASRLRLALEGSRPVTLASGAVLTPSLEMGVRQDSGDAETGTGLEVGAALAYDHPSSRVSANLKARALLVHADSGYREWGVSGALRLAPGGGNRGLSLSLLPAWGREGGGADHLWTAQDAVALTASSEGFEPTARLAAELGYGLPAFSDRFTGTPYLGLGWADAVQATASAGASPQWRMLTASSSPWRRNGDSAPARRKQSTSLASTSTPSGDPTGGWPALAALSPRHRAGHCQGPGPEGCSVFP